MKKFYITFAFIFAVMTGGFSQSVFSGLENGIGLKHYVSTARGFGMGGTGLATTDSMSLNAYNIAMWRYISDTKINLSLRYNYVKTELQPQSFTSSTGNFNGLQLGIPIQKKKWIIGLNIVPYSITNISYILNRDTGDQPYQENIFYEGNLARTQFNVIWAPVDGIGLAASLNYFFGNIRDRYYLFFDNAAISDIYYQIEYQMSGPGFGTSFDIALLEPFHFGGFIDLKPKINLTTITRDPISLQDQENKISTTLPIFLGMGASFQISPRWLITADGVYQDLSDALEQNQAGNLEPYYQISAGIEHSHSGTRRRAFFQKFDARAGFSYSNLGYVYNGNSVKEMAVHLGFGIPFFQGHARLDLGFMAGIRGDMTENLVEEKFFRSIISISAGELWYQNIR